MKKILIIITRGDSIGGAQIYVIRLANFLKNSFEVTVAYGADSDVKDLMKPHLESLGLNFIRLNELENSLNPIKLYKSYSQIRKVIIEFNPDLISLNSSLVGILGRLCAYNLSKRWVFTVHGWSYTDGISFFKKIIFKNTEYLISKLGGYWILVSNHDYNLGENNNTIISENSKVIYNSFQKKESVKVFKYDQRFLNVVMVARHTKQKDHITLINAIKKINNIKVYLIGDGDLLEKNKQYAIKKGVINKIEFLGYQRDVYKYLVSCDVFVLISNWEGFPISTLEAMSFSKPCIISDVGGAAEAIEEGVNGFAIKRKDVKNLADKLKKLMLNKDLMKDMGKHSKTIAQNKFTEDVVFNQTKDFFSYIISNE